MLLVAASSSLRVEGDKEEERCSRVGTMLLCALGMSAALLVFYGANLALTLALVLVLTLTRLPTSPRC